MTIIIIIIIIMIIIIIVKISIIILIIIISIFSPETGIHGSEITPNLDTLHELVLGFLSNIYVEFF